MQRRNDASASTSHPGNKQALPSKPCAACGRPMTWRKRWARVWDEVRYCSDRCRKSRTRAAPHGDLT
ncbi:MAG: DUF2256 domain-containing protein [Pseudomonadales bacterium]